MSADADGLRRWSPPILVTVVVAVLLWWAWPSLAASTTADTVVIGDGAVAASVDELGRRFRQEGHVVEVLVVDAQDCPDVPGDASGADRVIVSFAGWEGCGPWPDDVALLVQQPGGGDPRPASGTVDVRLASDLFTGGDRAPCEWWDTPGAGEDRPGLGQCAADGWVTVSIDGVLTDAGRERFARLVVASIR
jgi:hypothetical protein